MTPFMEYHPGGVKYIMSAAGKDGTKVRFWDAKPRAFPSDFPDSLLLFAWTQRGSASSSSALDGAWLAVLFFLSCAHHLESLNPKPSTLTPNPMIRLSPRSCSTSFTPG
jgi:hypothetical protein